MPSAECRAQPGFDPRRIRCLGLGLKVADVKSTFLPPPPSFYFMRSCMGIYFYRRLVRWVSTFCQPPPVSPSPSLPQSPSQSPRPVPTHVQIRGPHGPGGCPPWQLHTPTPHSATERGRATAKTVNRMGKSAPRPLACQVYRWITELRHDMTLSMASAFSRCHAESRSTAVKLPNASGHCSRTCSNSLCRQPILIWSYRP